MMSIFDMSFGSKSAHLRTRSAINLVNFEQLKGKEVINGKTRIR